MTCANQRLDGLERSTQAWRGREVGRGAGLGRMELVVILAIVALAAAVAAPLLIPRLARHHDAENLARCKGNLHSLGAALLLYAQDNAGHFPVSPTVDNPQLELTGILGTGKYIPDHALFYCPSEQRPILSYSEDHFSAGVIGYFYYSAAQASADESLSKFLRTGVTWPRELTTSADAKSWVMSDIWNSGVPTAHAPYRKGVNYLMLDGAVDFVEESPRHAFH